MIKATSIKLCLVLKTQRNHRGPGRLPRTVAHLLKMVDPLPWQGMPCFFDDSVYNALGMIFRLVLNQHGGLVGRVLAQAKKKIPVKKPLYQKPWCGIKS